MQNAIESKVRDRTTKQYKDYMGQRFVNYTLSYAKWKPKKTGKNITIEKYKKTAKKGTPIPQEVDLTLTGKMLSDFYVEVTGKPIMIKLFNKTTTLGSIKIKYGISTREGEESLKRYYYNAHGRKRKDGIISARDFLGMANNKWLMPENELKEIIYNYI